MEKKRATQKIQTKQPQQQHKFVKRAYCEIISDISDVCNLRKNQLKNKSEDKTDLKNLLGELFYSYQITLSTDFLKNLIDKKSKRQKTTRLFRVLKEQQIKPNAQINQEIKEKYFSVIPLEITDYSFNENGQICFFKRTDNEVLIEQTNTEIKTLKTFEFNPNPNQTNSINPPNQKP